MRIKCGNMFIDCRIVRKNIKNINIRVENSGEIIVSCPVHTDMKVVESIVRDKNEWILQRLNTVKERKDKLKKLGIGGMTGLPFLGKVLPVEKYEINIDKLSVKFADDRVIICGNEKLFSDRESMRCEVYKAYKKNLYAVLMERIDIYREILGVRPLKISVRSQKTIWGSCSSGGNLSFNCRLMMAPLKAIDYVVVHELCHMVYMNHSRTYWNLVESVIPDYRDAQKWLDDNGYMLNFYFYDVFL